MAMFIPAVMESGRKILINLDDVQTVFPEGEVVDFHFFEDDKIRVKLSGEVLRFLNQSGVFDQ